MPLYLAPIDDTPVNDSRLLAIWVAEHRLGQPARGPFGQLPMELKLECQQHRGCETSSVGVSYQGSGEIELRINFQEEYYVAQSGRLV